MGGMVDESSDRTMNPEESEIAEVLTEIAADAVATPENIRIFAGFAGTVPNLQSLWNYYTAHWDVDDPAGSLTLYGGGKRYEVDITVDVKEVS
jgi:hypothetical protein